MEKRFVEIIDVKQNDVILDVGSGSGDIAKEIIKSKLSNNFYLLDLNKEMLEEGKKDWKMKKFKIYYRQCRKLNFEKNFLINI